MTTLPKHLRSRWRYLGVGLRAWPDAQITRREFQTAIWRSARSLLGDAGRSRLDLRLFEFTCRDGYGEAVVRTPRGREDASRAVLACVSQIGEAPVGLRVRGVSGTVRGCEESYLGRRPERSEESKVVFTGAERSAVHRDDEIDIRTPEAFVAATSLDLES